MNQPNTVIQDSLSVALAQAQSLLKTEAKVILSGRWSNTYLIFGQEYDQNALTTILQDWQNNDFSLIPPIEILTPEQLNGALGAFSAQTNKIYLSSVLIADNNIDAMVRTLLEEIGHKVDSVINTTDAQGDEGAIFASVVLGESLSEETLQALKTEDDTATITVNGQVIQVEKQTTLYIKQFGTSSYDYAYGISTDSNGNIYVSGYTSGSMPGNSNLGDGDAYLAKYDANGNQLWVKQFGTYTGDVAYDISTDSNSNIYVTGDTPGSMPGNSNLGSYDAYLAKYDANGNQLWLKQFGTSTDDYANDISTDSNGNIYVSGSTMGSMPGNSNLGWWDAYLAKYDANGNQLWVKQFGTSSENYANDISTDSNGNIYVSGSTYGSMPGNSNLGYYDAYLAKYDANGNQLWIKQFGTSTDDGANDISTDSNGNIYVIGSTYGSMPGNSNLGSSDAYLAKYDANGNQLWVKQFGTSTDDGANDISTDSNGNIYVIGNTRGSMPGNSNLGDYDAYLAKYDANGNQLWIKQFGTSTEDVANDISTDSNGNIYVSGYTNGSMPGNSNLGARDAFIVGFDSNGNFLDTSVGIVVTGDANANDLEGGLGNDTINGLGGNDTLTGFEGADAMFGGAGNDIYYVDDSTDVVSETNPNSSDAGGTDTVYATVNYTLPNFVENLNLIPDSITNLNGTGNSLNNTIIGNRGANLLIGDTGNDSLNGGKGSDTLNGGAGNDTYYVDRLTDVTIDSAGTDTVQSSLTWTLADGIENLTLTGSSNINGTGNSANNVLTGNTGNNTLTGLAGNDTISGGTGLDTMIGGLDNDSYTVDNVGDVVTELVDEGTDLVNSSLTYTLGANVENLTLTGSAVINGTGNTLANTITGNTGVNILTGLDGNDSLVGNAGNDTLLGGNGNDTLVGSAGNDNLTGGSGLDSFRFNAKTEGIDTITDFNVADDTILVLKSGFSTDLITNATITTTQFILGSVATTSTHRFGYDSSNGKLWFDSDGSGATAAVQIATLSTGLAMTNADIAVV